MLGVAEGAPVGCAGVSQGPELAKPVLSHRGTHFHLTREPRGAAFEGELGTLPEVPRGGSSPAHLGACACDFPYSDLREPHPVPDHLLSQAICGDEVTHRIHTHSNSDKKSHCLHCCVSDTELNALHMTLIPIISVPEISSLFPRCTSFFSWTHR